MFSLRSSTCLFLFISLVSAVSIVPAVRAKDAKLKPEQLIEKHLDSIGSGEALGRVKTRFTSGIAHITFRVGGFGDTEGVGNVLSEGTSINASLRFPALNYPGEVFLYDGNTVSVGQISPGVRSNLGTFVYTNDELLSDGLMFGTLSTSWALLGQRDTKSKMELNGPKKIDGRLLYELKYTPHHTNGNVTSFFYFDPETFRHVRSEFRAEIPAGAGGRGRGGAGGAGAGGAGAGGNGGRAGGAGTGTGGAGGRAGGATGPGSGAGAAAGGGRGGGGGRGQAASGALVHYLITERFDDFKQVDGLTLPYSYTMDFSVDAPGRSFVGTWTYSVKEIAHNQPIDRKVFSAN